MKKDLVLKQELEKLENLMSDFLNDNLFLNNEKSIIFNTLKREIELYKSLIKKGF